MLARYPTLTDADDIIQDAIIRVLKARESAELLIPKAFLYATAKNLALDQLRKNTDYLHRFFSEFRRLGRLR
jgi:DNA-directed RNA polymerase specialized sigma24 family protein